MRTQKQTILLAVASAAHAFRSPWVQDYDSMLETINCRNGPKFCGIDNYFGDGGQYCGDGNGCYSVPFSEWELCVSVAQWQCYIQCDEGEVLNPLQWCQCIPIEKQYDMFCAPDDFSRELASIGETCEGFDESINGPYPDCADGLECRDAGMLSIPGAEKSCQLPIHLDHPECTIVAGPNEICEGFDETTGGPFPSCMEGLICRDTGLITIPGQEKTCQYAPLYAKQGEVCEGFDHQTGMPYPKCEEGLACVETRYVTIPGAGNTCQEPTAKLGETCLGFNENTGKPYPACEQGLECINTGLASDPGAEKACSLALDICENKELFDHDVCMCRSEIMCALECPPDTIADPIDNCSCYSPEEFNDKYAHTKGSDCIEGTSDDFKVYYSFSEPQCESGYYFDQEACQCFSLAQCYMMCPLGYDLDPRYPCKCEFESNIDKIFEHGLGETCGF